VRSKATRRADCKNAETKHPREAKLLARAKRGAAGVCAQTEEREKERERRET